MKKFIIDIVAGLVVFCIIWVAVEYYMTYHVVNTYTYKYNYVKDNPAIKTLLIGHSHFDHSINPYLMGDSLFDFAISGRRWIYWDVKLAEQLFPTMPNLKTVIFPLGYAMPYESPHYEKHLSLEREEYLYKYSKFMFVPYDVFPQKIKYCSALLSNKMGKKEYWVDEPQDSLGYHKKEGQSTWFDEWTKEAQIAWDNDTTYLCYNEYRGYLLHLAQICADNHIRFVIVTCPCADSYVACTTEQGIRNMYALVDSVARYYPVEYYNYLNDEAFRDDSIYYECSHLNTTGADKFAIRLKEDLNL